MKNSFKGRTLASSRDLSLDERLYLIEKARILKHAIRSKPRDLKVMDQFRINDSDFGIYMNIFEKEVTAI